MTEEEYKDHQEFLEQVEKDVRENNRRNAIAGVLIVLGMFVVLFILALLGANPESIRLPWAP